MAPRNEPATLVAEQELVITRRFDAPRQRVFEAWTDPRHAKSWWGPRDTPSPIWRWTSGPAAPGAGA